MGSGTTPVIDETKQGSKGGQQCVTISDACLTAPNCFLSGQRKVVANSIRNAYCSCLLTPVRPRHVASTIPRAGFYGDPKVKSTIILGRLGSASDGRNLPLPNKAHKFKIRRP